MATAKMRRRNSPVSNVPGSVLIFGTNEARTPTVVMDRITKAMGRSGAKR